MAAPGPADGRSAGPIGVASLRVGGVGPRGFIVTDLTVCFIRCWCATTWWTEGLQTSRVLHGPETASLLSGSLFHPLSLHVFLQV
ncbi:hypothetical protein chiPu_0019459 [Chiloscyllium punctatum]|uniref:Uncharacterized protein n=1 Tax=Chiloscyllium punctatum TaxID=137246 RepID=A0A401RRY1_CHIPU|nr:hypothetical protein [Chiloscyllium punctatum]